MYILKTKGTAKIPDYFQVRDENFVLVNHFKSDLPGKILNIEELKDRYEEILEIIKTIQYGELKKIS